jgi:hypothetical protein
MPRDAVIEHLHPQFRGPVRELLQRLQQEQLPFRLFEGFRTPASQRDLYAQGRTRPGNIVTKAGPWRSFHQYGFAADFVLYLDGQWSWTNTGERAAWWNTLHAYGRQLGLEPLGWEAPHLQLKGLRIDDLHAGHFPAGGDAAWGEHLELAIHGWHGGPTAPRSPRHDVERPPIDEGAVASQPDVDTPQPSLNASHRVIARNGLRLRSGPAATFDIVRNLPLGQTVNVISSRNGWSLVDLQGDGFADGYCHAGYLAPVT